MKRWGGVGCAEGCTASVSSVADNVPQGTGGQALSISIKTLTNGGDLQCEATDEEEGMDGRRKEEEAWEGGRQGEEGMEVI